METTDTHNPRLVLHVEKSAPQLFSTLLQSGFQVAAEPTDTIGTFLTRLPGFTDEYVQREVQTIFLNGTATDDLQTPISGKQPTLAITTAMPGLAGAIFRKNSPHAPLRTTRVEKSAADTPPLSTVTLKIFTTIGKEMGPGLLRRGVDLKAADLHSFFGYRPSLLGRIDEISIDGRECTAEDMLSFLKSSEMIHLSVLA